MWGYPNNSGCVAKFLIFFKSCKIITVSHLNSTNFNNNFKDNSMSEKMKKMTQKLKL